MRYVFAYTIGLTIGVGAALASPGVLASSGLLVIGSHLSGCLCASWLWLAEIHLRLRKEARQWEGLSRSGMAG